MAAPQVTEYTGDIPLRTQDQTTFSTNTGNLLTWWPTSVPEMNTLATFVNDQAESAELSAQNSEVSASSAVAGSNFKGRWSDATGAATIPASYSDDGKIWMLLQNIPDITLDQPSNTAPNWQQITYRDLYDDTQTYSRDERIIDLIDNKPYISTKNGNINNTPSADTTGQWWIPDTPILDWGDGRDYAVGEQAYSTIDGRRYKSQVTPNLGNEPSVDDGTYWTNEYGKVVKPTMTSPTGLETGVANRPTLTASAFTVIGSDNLHEYSVWQIASDAGFTDIVYSSGIVEPGNHKVTVALPDLTTFYARVAYKGVRTDTSEYANAVQFTTGVSLTNFISYGNFTGNGVSISVDTGLDLSANDGSLTVVNRRPASGQGRQYHTKTGLKGGETYDATIPVIEAQGLQSFDIDGFTLGTLIRVNESGEAISYYSIRDRVGIHDTVLYTGNGASTRTIAHNLGVTAGMVIFKRLETFQTSYSDYWYDHTDITSTYIRGLGTGNQRTGGGVLTDTTFTVGGIYTNGSGEDMVAEVFAHNPPAGIYCGSYVGNGGSLKVTIGFPVGFVLASTAGGARVFDNKNTYQLILSGSFSEENTGGTATFDEDGFTVSGNLNNSATTYYYVAIADPDQF